MKLLYYPNKTLITVAKPVNEHKIREIQPKIKNMFKIMVENSGIGISACQVGWPVALFCLKTDNMKEVFINPKVVSLPSTKETMVEGCLSYPGLWLEKERHNAVMLEYTNTEGKRLKKLFEGLECRVILHELEHLRGESYATR